MKQHGVKFLFVLFLVSVFSLSFGVSNVSAFGKQGGSGECTDCHTLTKKEAAKLLHTEKYRAAIKEVKLSSVKGLWEVHVEQGDKNLVLYIDFAKQNLVEGRFTPLEKIGKGPDLKIIDRSLIPLDRALLFGSKTAKHKVIVFDDPECTYCKKLHPEIKKIIKSRKDIAFYIKLYPLPSHPGAYDKATAIVCAGSGSMLEDAFNGKTLPKPQCETDEIDNNLKLGKKLKISGTPAIILPDGRLLPGYVPAKVIIDLIDTPLDPSKKQAN